MLRRFALWLSRRLGNPRVIFDREGGSAYLSRWYVFGTPKMADGTDPFDQYGNPKRDAIWPTGTWGLYLHRFHRSDDYGELHNHPWRWALSFVLAGGYREERRRGDAVVQRMVRPGRLNFLGGDSFHRVDLLGYDAWSLFLVGPKVSSWGFWNRVTGEFTQWREFIARKRGIPSGEVVK